MNGVIYEPLSEYLNKYKLSHSQSTDTFFNALVERSGVNIDENRQTVSKYNELTENLKKLKRKYNLLRFLRVLMIITLILIPLVILKTTPKIRQLREEIANAEKTAAKLLELAQKQMAPLNCLFTSRDCIKLVQDTIPLLSFESCFDVKQEEDMKLNYDFTGINNVNHSTLDVLSGSYNENPFVFENRLVHTVGTQTYHGYKTIHWTEHYIDSDGKSRTRTRSQTLHATVEKPKPFYSTEVVLNYGSQGAPDLSFSRSAGGINLISDKAIQRHIKRTQKKLRRKGDKALRKGKEFTLMANSEFEVLFNATDRNDEVQFRTLFTPLAQTNTVALILSDETFGDDFDFIKCKRMNTVASKHSQGRKLFIDVSEYASYSFDIIEHNFKSKNEQYFKEVYFDFAPILAIPAYQERPVHSLKPLPDYSQLYSRKECEVLANCLGTSLVAHPSTKTNVIIKSEYLSKSGNVETALVTAYSYDIAQRTDYVSVFGGDGHMHSVAVHWDEYLPLSQTNEFNITTAASAQSCLASKNGLAIYK